MTESRLHALDTLRGLAAVGGARGLEGLEQNAFVVDAAYPGAAVVESTDQALWELMFALPIPVLVSQRVEPRYAEHHDV